MNNIQKEKKIIENMVCLGFGKDAIIYMFGKTEKYLDKLCYEIYGNCFEDIMSEIEYAKNINQDKEKPYTVYMHIAPNGKKYVGITKSRLNKRWSNGKGYWANKYFSNAIKKYGWENIKHAILYMKLTKEEAEEKEKELIKKFQTTDRRFGYNIEGGGGLKKEVSLETREKLRKNATGIHPSEETRRKMSESHKGEKCHFYGTHLNEERKEKLREIKSKQVIQMTESGEIIKTFPSMKEAAYSLGITRQAITSCCNGKTKKCKGYVWRLV